MSFVDERTGRELALEELSRPVYAEAQPSWFDRILMWILERVFDLMSLAETAPGGRWLLAALFVAVVVLLIWAARKWRITSRSDDQRIYEGLNHSPAVDYLELAEAHILEDRWDLALLAATRAIVAQLQSKSLVPGGPGVTILEVRSGTSEQDIIDVLNTFEIVQYGGQSCRPDQAMAALATAKRSVATRSGSR